MSKGKKHLRFLGHDLTKWQHRSLISLIEMTSGRFGVHKKGFASETEFWDVIERLTGFRQSPLENFIEAFLRVSRDVGAKGIDWRNAKIADFSADDLRAMLSRPAKIKAQKAARTRRMVPAKTATARPSFSIKDAFYKSWEWRTLRMEVIKEYGRACQCCGAEPGMKTASGDPVRICVDHIKPLSKYWELRLVRSNLQILCDECNQGKGNWDHTDFRKPEAPDEWIIEDDGIDPALIHQLTDLTTGKLQ